MMPLCWLSNWAKVRSKTYLLSIEERVFQSDGKKGPIFASRLTPFLSSIRTVAMAVTILLTLATVILVFGVNSVKYCFALSADVRDSP